MTSPWPGEGPDSELVVGYDGRDGGRDALRLGSDLARASGAKLSVVTCVPFPPATLGEQSGETRAPAETWPELRERLIERGHDLLHGARETLGELEHDEEVVVDDSPARALAIFAERRGAELVVLGSSHRGRLGRVLAGTIPAKLLAGGGFAVAVAPRGYADREPAGVGAVCVGWDGQPESERALGAAAEVARQRGAALRVHAVVEPSRSLEYEFSGEVLREALDVLAGKGLRDRRGEGLRESAARALAASAEDVESEVVVSHGNAAEHLAGLPASECDLLVLGSRGYGPLGRVVLGSTSKKVTEAASVPVLVLPRAHRDDGAKDAEATH